MNEQNINIIPAMHCIDARAAIDWLVRAFGCEAGAVYEDENGGIAHAELWFGGACIMLGSARDNDLGMVLPGAAGGVTQSVYAVVEDADAHFARATAAGAQVVRAIGDTAYGSREYSVRDPEGHLWSFGTYRPTRARV